MPLYHDVQPVSERRKLFNLSPQAFYDASPYAKPRPSTTISLRNPRNKSNNHNPKALHNQHTSPRNPKRHPHELHRQHPNMPSRHPKHEQTKRARWHPPCAQEPLALGLDDQMQVPQLDGERCQAGHDQDPEPVVLDEAREVEQKVIACLHGAHQEDQQEGDASGAEGHGSDEGVAGVEDGGEVCAVVWERAEVWAPVMVGEVHYWCCVLIFWRNARRR